MSEKILVRSTFAFASAPGIEIEATLTLEHDGIDATAKVMIDGVEWGHTRESNTFGDDCGAHWLRDATIANDVSAVPLVARQALRCATRALIAIVQTLPREI